MTPSDVPAGLRLSTTANWNQLAEDWLVFHDSPGSGAFVAENESGIVGSAAFLRYDQLAWVAMMLVSPDQRRHGIGAELLSQVLDCLQDVPCVGLDATPLGEPLYRRFDFISDRTFLRATTTVEGSRFADCRNSVRPMNATDLPTVFARDLDVFGADRSALLSSFFARAPECAWVAYDGGQLRGYTFGRPGRLFWQLGPIIADHVDTARDLVGGCLPGLDGRRIGVDVPQADAVWLDWLVSIGFVMERPFTRMFRHGHVHPGDPALQFAITGPEFA